MAATSPQAQAAGEAEGGAKRMKMVGRVEVPQEAFIAALSTGDIESART
jgi:translation elongation factor EF-4